MIQGDKSISEDFSEVFFLDSIKVPSQISSDIHTFICSSSLVITGLENASWRLHKFVCKLTLFCFIQIFPVFSDHNSINLKHYCFDNLKGVKLIVFL